MTTPAKSTVIKIKGNEYTVQFPNTGQYIDIQSLRTKIASDNYHLIALSTDSDSGYAMLLCDMIATFNVLIPELKDNLNISSMLGLSMIESRELLDSYLKYWIPFYKQWMDILSSAKTDVESVAPIA